MFRLSAYIALNHLQQPSSFSLPLSVSIVPLFSGCVCACVGVKCCVNTIKTKTHAGRPCWGSQRNARVACGLPHTHTQRVICTFRAKSLRDLLVCVCVYIRLHVVYALAQPEPRSECHHRNNNGQYFRSFVEATRIRTAEWDESSKDAFKIKTQPKFQFSKIRFFFIMYIV